MGKSFYGRGEFIYLFIFAACTEPLELWQGSGILEAPSCPMLVIGRSFYEENEEAEKAEKAQTEEEAETA